MLKIDNRIIKFTEWKKILQLCQNHTEIEIILGTKIKPLESENKFSIFKTSCDYGIYTKILKMYENCKSFESETNNNEVYHEYKHNEMTLTVDKNGYQECWIYSKYTFYDMINKDVNTGLDIRMTISQKYNLSIDLFPPNKNYHYIGTCKKKRYKYNEVIFIDFYEYQGNNKNESRKYYEVRFGFLKEKVTMEVIDQLFLFIYDIFSYNNIPF